MRTVWCMLALLLAGVAFGAPVFRLELPQDAAPEKMVVLLGQYGAGLVLWQLPTKAGVFSYRHTCVEKLTRLQVLIYRPGYRVVTAAFDRKALDAGTVYTPTFTPLPVMTLQGEVVNGQGQPIAREKIIFSHDLAEMKYFNYLDGRTTGATDAEVMTDDQGRFTVQLPTLTDDPHYTTYAPLYAGFRVRPVYGAGDGCGVRWDYRPDTLQPKAGEPLRIEKINRATVTVTLTPAFRQQWGLTDGQRLWLMVRPIGIRGGWGSMISGYSITTTLPPGAYRLSVEVQGENGETVKEIGLAEALTLTKGETWAVTLPTN